MTESTSSTGNFLAGKRDSFGEEVELGKGEMGQPAHTKDWPGKKERAEKPRLFQGMVN